MTSQVGKTALSDNIESLDDTGIFGPDSVTWRVHADPIMLVAGLRALLLQAVHPVAMAGVAQFSDYRTNPWRRLQRTAEFVSKTTYGTTTEAKDLGATVRNIHDRLEGSNPDTGQPFRVSDPELLRWVHVCEAESFLTTFQRAGGRLRPGDADRYYAESQAAAALVGCYDVPSTAADVRTYFAEIQPQLRVTEDARAAAMFLVNPPMPRWVSLATPAKPAWWALGGLGLSLLPRWARRLYALPGLPTTDFSASLAVRALRTTLFAIPASVREGPSVREARIRTGWAA
jgi:uncharacterized protein (DUF2236 family)